MDIPDLRGVDPTTIVRRVSPVVIIAAVLALVFIASATLIATLFAPKGHDTAVVTAFVVGTIAPTIVGLLALIRGDHAVQVGETNAKRLVQTAAKMEQVAADVNGHLTRHDELAEKIAGVAQTIADSAGVQVEIPRDPDTRTRATDPPTSTAHPVDVGDQADARPLTDQT